MCRLAFITKESSSNPAIIKLLAYLEKSKGGDGNGVGFISRKELVIEKAVDMTPKECFKSAKGRTFIFHTRLASVGAVTYDNCHPFIVGNHIYAHNGGFGGYDHFRTAMAANGVDIDGNDVTDSLVLAYVAEYFDIRMRKLRKIPGMFGVLLRLNKDFTAKVLVKGCEFKAAKLDGQWVYASDFPDDKRFEDVQAFYHGSVATLTKHGPKFEKGGMRHVAPKVRTVQTTLSNRVGHWSAGAGQ